MPNGSISVSGRIEGDDVPLAEVATADISGQVTLAITQTSSGPIDLNQIDITLTEYIPLVYDYFTFGVNDDGKTATLTDYYSSLSDSTDVVIPSTVSQNLSGEWIEGNTYTVTAIADGGYNWGVFYDSGITSVTFPSSLTSIGNNAFNGCRGLTSVDLSGCTSLTSIGSWAFYGCSALESVVFPEGSTGWEVSTSSSMTNPISVDVTNSSTNARNLTDTYDNYYWKRNV